MSARSAPQAVEIGSVRIDARDMRRATQELIDSAASGEPLAVHLVNAYTVSLAVRDREFAGILNGGDLNLPDGTPVAWFGRRAGATGFDGPVPGPDLTANVCDEGRASGLRHYLYGSSPEVVDRFADNLRRRYPGIEIVGVESPPFRPLSVSERDDLVGRVRDSEANILWVGLGTPKQDHFVDEFRDSLGIPLVAVGAAFDFIAGEKKVAPAWMRRRGLEWLYRLLSEPRRLWRRYLIGNALFLAAVWRGVEPHRAEE
jgi:N-acetylglucosaminyldiphosphoundecaprenol N-acetyl-beta-D-mannosaminyltransferase